MSALPTVHIFHHSFCEGGGIERYSREFARELVARGRKVVFHARRIDRETPASKGIEFNQLRTWMFPRKLRDYYYHRRVAAIAPGIGGTQFAMTRVPVKDGEVCGGTHRGYFAKARKTMGPFDHLQVAMEMKSYHHCRVVVSHSHLCTQELMELYQLPENRIATIHPPADLNRFHPVSNEERVQLREQFGFSSDKIVLAFPSTGHRRKGLYPLCKALESFGDRVVLALAGRPTRNPPAFVRYLGHLSGDEMANLYQASDFTAMASYYEPFGLIGPESIMCGTPVLFEKRMGCLEVIDPKAAITFDVWDPESIKRSVAEALDRFDSGKSRLDDPGRFLNYDPSLEGHVKKVMAVLEPED